MNEIESQEMEVLEVRTEVRCSAVTKISQGVGLC